MGDIQTFADTLDTRLSTISGLRVYKGPVENVNEFPCAIITDHSALARYTIESDEGVYFLDITLLDDAADSQEAWENLEPYLSASGSQSIRAAVDLTGGTDMSYIHVVSASGRQRIRHGSGSYWGAILLVEGRVKTS